MALTADELIEIAKRACALAKKHGADAAEAQVQAGGELTDALAGVRCEPGDVDERLDT